MPRVLVVEDSVSMRAFVRGVLEDGIPGLGPVDVVEAASGFDALRLLPRGPYDLVITDINMPTSDGMELLRYAKATREDINGLELVQFIRSSEQHRSIPVLLISTRSSDRDRERGLSLGANGYLAKPFTAEDLCHEAMRYLAHDQQQVESHD
jgi:two-component system chemotaxis response regulator CheY